MRPSSGGGQTRFVAPREVDAVDVAVPPGYNVEVVATGLTYPTGGAFDQDGRPYVVEAGYSYGEDWTSFEKYMLGAGMAFQTFWGKSR